MRYKENIENLSLGLDAVLQMRPVSFDWKKEYIINPHAPRQIGFIAEEMEQISPLFVTYEDGLVDGVEYMKLTSVLAMAIQEMNLKIEDLASPVPAPGSFADKFFTNLFAKVTSWLADAGNGIVKIFTKEVNTETLCVSDESGAKTCINKAQLDALLNQAGNANQGSSGGGGSSPALSPAPEPEPSAPEPTPAPEPEAISEPEPTTPTEGEPEPAPEPTPEPAPEPSPAPEPAPSSSPEPAAE